MNSLIQEAEVRFVFLNRFPGYSDTSVVLSTEKEGKQ